MSFPEKPCRSDCDGPHVWSDAAEGAPWFRCPGKPGPCPPMKLADGSREHARTTSAATLAYPTLHLGRGTKWIKPPKKGRAA